MLLTLMARLVGEPTAYPSAVDFGALSLASAGKVQLADAGATITSGNGAGEWRLDASGYLTKVADTTLASASYSLGLSDGRTVTVTRLADTYSVATVDEATTLLDVVKNGSASNGILKKATHTTTATVLLRPGTYDATPVKRTVTEDYRHWAIWLMKGDNTGSITIGCHGGDRSAIVYAMGGARAVNGATYCCHLMTLEDLTIIPTDSTNMTPPYYQTDRSSPFNFTHDTGTVTIDNCNIYSTLRSVDNTRYNTDEAGLFCLLETNGTAYGTFTIQNCDFHGARRLVSLGAVSGSGKFVLSSNTFYDFSNDHLAFANTQKVDILDNHFHSPYTSPLSTLQTYSAGTAYGVSEMVNYGGTKYVNGVAGSTGVTPGSVQATFTGTVTSGSLSVSGVTGTIAIGQWVDIGDTYPLRITGGSGSTWTCYPASSGSATESKNWYSPVAAHRDAGQWVGAGGINTTSTSDISILRNVVYDQRYDGVATDSDMQGLPFIADSSAWNISQLDIRGNTMVLGSTTHGISVCVPTDSVWENNTVVSIPSLATDSLPGIRQNAADGTVALTGASWAAGTATVTHGGGTIPAGYTITVASVTPSGYNKTSATVTTSSAGSVSYAVASDPGAYTSGGTLQMVAYNNTVRNNVSSSILGTYTNWYEAVTASETTQAQIEARYATMFVGPTWEGFTSKAELLAAYAIKENGPLDIALPKIGACSAFVDYTNKTITDWVYGTPTIGAFANGNYTNATASTQYSSGAATITGGTAGQFCGIDYSVSPSTAEFRINGGTWRKSSTTCSPSDTIEVRWTTGVDEDGSTTTIRAVVGTTTKDWTVQMALGGIADLIGTYGGVLWDFTTGSIFTDTAGTTAATNNGDTIARVNDSSGAGGLGYYASHATAGPILRTNGNGKKYAEFTGSSSQHLVPSTIINSSTENSMTVFVAGFTTSVTTAQHVFGVRNAANSYVNVGVRGASSQWQIEQRDATSTVRSGVATLSNNTDFYAAAIKNGESKTARLNGTAGTTESTDKAGAATTHERLGCGYVSANSSYFTGGIYAIVIIPSAVTNASDIAVIEGWMAARYAA